MVSSLWMIPFTVLTFLMHCYYENMDYSCWRVFLFVFIFLCWMGFTASDFGVSPADPVTTHYGKRVQVQWSFCRASTVHRGKLKSVYMAGTAQLPAQALVPWHFLSFERPAEPGRAPWVEAWPPLQAWLERGTLLSLIRPLLATSLENHFSSGLLPRSNLTWEMQIVATDPINKSSRVRKTLRPLFYDKLSDSQSGFGFLWPQALIK